MWTYVDRWLKELEKLKDSKTTREIRLFSEYKRVLNAEISSLRLTAINSNQKGVRRVCNSEANRIEREMARIIDGEKDAVGAGRKL